MLKHRLQGLEVPGYAPEIELNNRCGFFFLHTIIADKLKYCYFINFTLKYLHFWSRHFRLATTLISMALMLKHFVENDVKQTSLCHAGELS